MNDNLAECMYALKELSKGPSYCIKYGADKSEELYGIKWINSEGFLSFALRVFMRITGYDNPEYRLMHFGDLCESRDIINVRKERDNLLEINKKLSNALNECEKERKKLIEAESSNKQSNENCLFQTIVNLSRDESKSFGSKKCVAVFIDDPMFATVYEQIRIRESINGTWNQTKEIDYTRAVAQWKNIMASKK